MRQIIKMVNTSTGRTLAVYEKTEFIHGRWLTWYQIYELENGTKIDCGTPSTNMILLIKEMVATLYGKEI